MWIKRKKEKQKLKWEKIPNKEQGGKNIFNWCSFSEGESLVRLLSCSDIVVHDEIIIFNSVQVKTNFYSVQ